MGVIGFYLTLAAISFAFIVWDIHGALMRAIRERPMACIIISGLMMLILLVELTLAWMRDVEVHDFTVIATGLYVVITVTTLAIHLITLSQSEKNK